MIVYIESKIIKIYQSAEGNSYDIKFLLFISSQKWIFEIYHISRKNFFTSF